MNTTTTNATSTPTSAFLLEAVEAGAWNGRFVGLVNRKVGKEVKGVRYDDAVVHAVILTGFSYPNLVKRSLQLLEELVATPGFVPGLVRNLSTKPGTDGAVNVAHVREAAAELAESFRKTLAGESVDPCAHVFEPLIVDGTPIRGAKVYTGEGDANDPRTPVKGQINISGLMIGRREIEAAPNGKAPAVKSKAKTIAKDALRNFLPLSKYVSYRLEAGTGYILNVGGNAYMEATKDGVEVDFTVAEGCE